MKVLEYDICHDLSDICHNIFYLAYKAL